MHTELMRRHVGKVRAVVDDKENVATFYLHGVLSNKILGYQVYNPKSTCKKSNIPRDSRYYTYQTSHKITGEYAIFGLEYIERRGILFVTEGIFEACRLINLGYDAVAILTSNPPTSLITQLFTISDTIVWCGDNDKAGKSSTLAKFPHMYFDVDLDEVDAYTLDKSIESVIYNEQIRRVE